MREIIKGEVSPFFRLIAVSDSQIMNDEFIGI